MRNVRLRSGFYGDFTFQVDENMLLVDFRAQLQQVVANGESAFGLNAHDIKRLQAMYRNTPEHISIICYSRNMMKPVLSDPPLLFDAYPAILEEAAYILAPPIKEFTALHWGYLPWKIDYCYHQKLPPETIKKNLFAECSKLPSNIKELTLPLDVIELLDDEELNQLGLAMPHLAVLNIIDKEGGVIEVSSIRTAYQELLNIEGSAPIPEVIIALIVEYHSGVSEKQLKTLLSTSIGNHGIFSSISPEQNELDSYIALRRAEEARRCILVVLFIDYAFRLRNFLWGADCFESQRGQDKINAAIKARDAIKAGATAIPDLNPAECQAIQTGRLGNLISRCDLEDLVSNSEAADNTP